MFKTTVKLALGAALLTPLIARAHYVPCEDRLFQARIYENLVDEAADFELELTGLESTCRGGRCLRDAQNLRAEFTLFVEDLLEQRHPAGEMLGTFARIVSRVTLLEIQALPSRSARDASPLTVLPTVLDYETKPEALRANEKIPTGNAGSYIHTVAFSPEILPEFWELNSQQQSKFLRAIYLGIVGPVGESGVKLLPFIAKNLVEVKAYGATRLLGCLETGSLRVLRLSHDTNHSRASLTKYRALCD